MIGPLLSTRIDEENSTAICRVDRGNVRSFKAIAVITGKSQILRRCLPSVLLGDNVVRFVRDQRVIFVKLAVFAAAA